MRCVLLGVVLGVVAVGDAAAVPWPSVKGRLPKSGAPPLDDPAALADRIAQNSKAAADRLAERDPGSDTRAAQEQTLRDLDALLKQASQSPPSGGGGEGGMPPPEGGMSQPKGGEGQKGANPPPKGGEGQKGGSQRRQRGQRGEPKDKGEQPQPGGQPMPKGSDPMGGQPMPKGGQPRPGMAGPGGPTGLPLDDPIAKQVWGHLPERLRQQMSQYYKEQFMPKYGPLLRDYFTSLAEREKMKK